MQRWNSCSLGGKRSFTAGPIDVRVADKPAVTPVETNDCIACFATAVKRLQRRAQIQDEGARKSRISGKKQTFWLTY